MWKLVIVLAVAGVAGLADIADQPTAPLAGEAAPAGDWRTDVLAGLGNAQPSEETLLFLAAWQRAEGGDAAYNWLNTTEDAPGATCYNATPCVKNYPDYQSGIRATVETLTNGRYPRTLAGLRDNQPIIDDAELGTWGTGGGAVRAQLEETQEGPSARVFSSPIAVAHDQGCGENVLVALDMNGGALRDVLIQPGETFSFNQSLGPQADDHATIYLCAGQWGGNWCNLAARYAQVARGLGFTPVFQTHPNVTDLGAGPENLVLIWAAGDGAPGNHDGAADLLVTNTTTRPVRWRAVETGDSVVIEGESL